MKENFEELSDKQAYAIENGKAIEGCISQPTYKNQSMDYLNEKLHCILLHKDSSEYDVKRYEKAEEKLRLAESEIIGMIGKKSFFDILEVIDLQKKFLREDIRKSWESYHELNLYINSTEGSLK
jgi:hypothetical protein